MEYILLRISPVMWYFHCFPTCDSILSNCITVFSWITISTLTDILQLSRWIVGANWTPVLCGPGCTVWTVVSLWARVGTVVRHGLIGKVTVVT